MPDKPIRYRPFRGLRPQAAPPRRSGSAFSAAMAREGTAPLADGPRRVPPARSSRPGPFGASAPTFEVEQDDDWLEGHRTSLSAEMRRRLRGTPTATLDLHRHYTEAARRRVTSFLARERANGHELVLVVVGRGHHSPGGKGVLRLEIGDWLTTPPTSSFVLAFRTAPRHLGGSGGVVVLLAQESRRARRG